MGEPRREIKKRAEPVDERGDLTERRPSLSPRERPPPPRLDTVTFPTNRLPQLEVPIIKKLPDVGRAPSQRHGDINDNHNIDPSLPLPVMPEKTMFNLWEKTRTQTEIKWSKPENASDFNSIAYEIQLKNGDADWLDLTENRLPVYRVYFAEGKAIFGRTKINQENSTLVIRLRIRPVGIISDQGREEKRFGPWTNDILFSLEGTAPKQ